MEPKITTKKDLVVEPVSETSTVAVNADSGYLIPASIIVAGLIIAFAIMSNGGNSNQLASTGGTLESGTVEPTNAVPDLESRLVLVAQAAGIDFAELQQCAEANTYDENVVRNASNGSETGGQGTPWSIVQDTETGNYYPINGALPTAQLTELFESGFAGAEITAEQNELLSAVNAYDKDLDYYRGSENARYIVFEYSDFNCSFCDRFHDSMKDVIQTRNDVGWVYRDLPFQRNSKEIANFIQCAGEGGKNDEAYWKAADAYFGSA